jgi:hypothetical protein
MMIPHEARFFCYECTGIVDSVDVDDDTPVSDERMDRFIRIMEIKALIRGLWDIFYDNGPDWKEAYDMIPRMTKVLERMELGR